MLSAWHDFFITAATAASTLTGLITVGVSIGLKTIIAHPQLPNKAIGSIVLLVVVLLIALLSLIPGQSSATMGSEVLGIGLAGWGSTSWLVGRALRATLPAYRRAAWFNMLLTQAATLPYLVAGGALLIGSSSGCYWIVPAVLLSLCKAVMDAWILLVEIHR